MKASSILKKFFMAVTGLALVGFLVTHLAGNLFLFTTRENFNAYAQALEDRPYVVYPAEFALLAIFLIHIFMALKLTLENEQARPEAYAERKNQGESTFASRTMWWTGSIIFVFIILHIRMFKFGPRHETHGLWGLVIERFSDWKVVALYLLAMLALGLHLSHAIRSAFQSLGLLKSTVWSRMRPVGQALGWGLAAGFAAMPLWAYLVKIDLINLHDRYRSAPKAAALEANAGPGGKTVMAPLDPVAVQGAAIATAKGCATCHSVDGTHLAGPSLKGIYKTPRTLADGRTVTADDEYLRQSILDHTASVVAGYPNTGPSYKGNISDKEVAALTEYIKSLGN